MKTIKRLLMIIGGLVVLVALLGWANVIFGFDRPKLAKQIILAADFSADIGGAPHGGGLLSRLLAQPSGPDNIVHILDRARRDERVLGLVIRFGAAEPALADAQEMRDALKRFKDAGKFTVSYATSFGEAEPALKSYYLASSLAEVWLQPVGVVGLNGISFEQPFLRGLLDKAGLKPEFITRKNFKTAASNLTDTNMNANNRLMMTSLLDSLSTQLITGIAENRALPVEKVQNLFGTGPISATDALAAKLVDRIGYQDELLDELKKRAGDKARLTNMFDYAAASDYDQPAFMTKAKTDAHKRIAVITLRGEIHSGHGETLPGRETAGADDITAAIDEALDNKDIKTIILRLDTPGGSPAASETIRRAVQLAEMRGKPVIVSMGSVAASGGYWVATGAKHIIAQPATLTGSIGVVVGKISGEDLLKKLSITFDGVSRGLMADLLSPARGFNTAERAKIESMADDVYAEFITRVKEARGLDDKEAENIAQGRVWTGAQAKDLKLVDELGGMDTAILRAKEKMGLPADALVYLDQLPHPPSRFEQIMDILSQYQQFALLAPHIMTDLRDVLSPALLHAQVQGF